jgi:hypothetical protein
MYEYLFAFSAAKIPMAVVVRAVQTMLLQYFSEISYQFYFFIFTIILKNDYQGSVTRVFRSYACRSQAASP